MYPVIEPAERAVLEEKLRTVLGSGAATTALLKIIDAVNFVGYPDPPLTVAVEPTPEATPEVAPEVQVVESSP
jgi:hypothetical protein